MGLDGTGPLVAAARAVAGADVDKAVIDTAAFRFATLGDFDHPDFLPGIVKYGDLPALIALGSPHPLWLAGEGGQAPQPAAAAYQAAGSPQQLTSWTGDDNQKRAAAALWLLGQP